MARHGKAVSEEELAEEWAGLTSRQRARIRMMEFGSDNPLEAYIDR